MHDLFCLRDLITFHAEIFLLKLLNMNVCVGEKWWYQEKAQTLPCCSNIIWYFFLSIKYFLNHRIVEYLELEGMHKSSSPSCLSLPCF